MVTETFSIARADHRPIMGRSWGDRHQLPENALAQAVGAETDQVDGLLVQPLDCVVQALLPVYIVPARQRVVNTSRPTFFLKSRQNDLLIFRGPPEALQHDRAKAQFSADLVPDWARLTRLRVAGMKGGTAAARERFWAYEGPPFRKRMKRATTPKRRGFPRARGKGNRCAHDPSTITIEIRPQKET